MTHTYELSLQEREFAYVLLDQRAVDLTADVLAPDGKLISSFDGRWHGPEPVFVRSTAQGVYRIEVRTVLKPSVSERYQVSLEVRRETMAEDEQRVAAAATGTDCKKLMTQATAASLQNAVKAYQNLLPVWRSLSDRYGEAATLNSLGFAHAMLGRYDDALSQYWTAVSLWRELGYERGEGETLLNIGAAVSLKGQRREALTYYEASLAISQRLGDLRRGLMATNNIGSVYGRLGEPRSAIARFTDALGLAEQVGDDVAVVAALTNIGTAHQAAGELQRALEFVGRAYKRAPPSDLRGRAVALTTLGGLQFRVGEPERARESFRQAMDLARSAGDSRIMASATLSLGSLLHHLGELAEALTTLRQAQELSESVKDRSGAALAMLHIADLEHKRGGAPREALATYRAALSDLELVGDVRHQALSHHGMAAVQASIGDRQSAHSSLNRALELIRAAKDRYSEAQILLSLARLCRDEGALDQARDHAEDALAIVETIRGEVSNQRFRMSFAASSREFYELAVDVLMRLHDHNRSGGFDLAALEVSERGRNRGLVELLNESRASIRQGVDPSLLARERELRERVNAKAEHLMALAGNKQAHQAAENLEKELDIVLTELRDLEAEIRVRSPGFGALTLPLPMRASEIQRQLDADTVLLVYWLHEGRSYAWAVSSTRITSVVLPGRAEIEMRSHRIHDLVTARGTQLARETVSQWRNRVARADAQLAATAAELSRMIIQPLLSEATAKRLVVVSEGALQYVPFGALPVPGSPNGRPLLTAHEVAHLPSVSSLTELRRDAASRPAPSRTIAVLADPVFGRDDPRILATASRGAPARPPSTSDGAADTPLADLDRAVRDVAPGLASPFPRLPETRREADAIRRHVPADKMLLALDFDASYATATSPDLARYRIVHFATHGLLNTIHPELTGIVLSLVDRAGRPQQGFLRAHEVYNLRLPAELVVLSGCRTGLGKDISGEGMVGLARGFMYAGTQRVVVSLWQVDDRATAELMDRFYAGILRDRMTPTAALRAAQLALWNMGRWRAPYYWAGFVNQGEWR